MISPPHKHDVLKNKKASKRVSECTKWHSQSVSSKLPGALFKFFFWGGGMGEGCEKMISPPHKHDVLKHLKSPPKGIRMHQMLPFFQKISGGSPPYPPHPPFRKELSLIFFFRP